MMATTLMTACLKPPRFVIEPSVRFDVVSQILRSKSRGLILLVTFVLATMTWSATAAAQESRTWTDASGKFTVEAILKEVKRDSVVLIMTDGTEKTVPLAQLSADDRKYAADYRKAMLAENAAKKKATADAKKRGEDLKDELTGILQSFAQSEEQLKQAEQNPAQFRVARQSLVQETSQKLIELVSDVPQSDVARDVYLWVVRNGATDAPNSTATKMLVEHFADLPELAPMLGFLARDLSVLEKLVEKSKDESVKGVGTFLLAQQLANQENPALEDRVKKLLNQVLTKYATVIGVNRQPLGPQAEKLLFVLEHLSVGKVAPDISGADLDGVPFKLSDYRGKVVVIDFWGDW
ncbi:MAG: redoxin domain-containing protein [Planctomycetaceae bacterium]|nr:redoxin domain-containing protein [Planctomycetaceae bacterium]